MAFPSTLSTFNRPTTTDTLDSPSHSALHNDVSSAVGQVEETIGLSTTSTVGTLFYDIRSPDSDGGGHVQEANKGGTGQTSYSKGNVLVASSSSVLNKLAIGADDTFLRADSSEATGVTWSPAPGIITSSVITSSVLVGVEASVVSVTVAGSTLGTSNAIKARLFYELEQTTAANHSVIGRIQYGGGTISSVFLTSKAAIQASSIQSYMDFTMIENGITNAQVNFLETVVPIASVKSELTLDNYDTPTSSVESSADQTFGITLQSGASGGAPGKIIIQGAIVEKIS